MNDGPIVRRISFDIHGEFITQLAREWFYTGEKSHEKVIEILMDSMTGTDTPEAQIRRYAEDILLGRAALKGSTVAGTYHLETYEPGEEEQMPKSMNIWKRSRKAEESREGPAEDRQQDALDSFMARMMDEEEHTTEDYGWLEPNGTFHAVEWGDHQEWANDYLDKNLTQEERFAAMVEINASGMVKNSPDVIGAADYLVRRGWVLLHNPQQGIAIPTRDITREYTKAQKEFLYDYYMERDCKEEANAIWQDE